MNVLLFFIAYILFLPFSLINYIYVVYVKDKTSKGYFRTSAVNIDRFGNQEIKAILNAALITKDGYKFGDIRETISSVLGKNERDGTLSKVGKILVKILNTIHEGHTQDSIHIFD